jgi:hypothetical protein
LESESLARRTYPGGPSGLHRPRRSASVAARNASRFGLNTMHRARACPDTSRAITRTRCAASTPPFGARVCSSPATSAVGFAFPRPSITGWRGTAFFRSHGFGGEHLGRGCGSSRRGTLPGSGSCYASGAAAGSRARVTGFAPGKDFSSEVSPEYPRPPIRPQPSFPSWPAERVQPSAALLPSRV